MNRAPDLPIGAAAAQIACHRSVDLAVRWIRGALKERCGRHDLARLAIAALRNRFLNPGTLKRMRRVWRKALDCRHLAADDRCDIDAAGFDQPAVDMHRAGAAFGDPASELSACEAKLFSQYPKQWSFGIGVDLMGRTVHREGQQHRNPPWTRARKVSQRSSCNGMA